MATSYDNWHFKNQRVREDHIEGNFASADATLICSGPPLITGTPTGIDRAAGLVYSASMPSGSYVYPIGYLENFALQQSKQLQRLWEIGSQRSYFIPGRVMGSISLGRVFYHGFSLLRVLYPHLGEQGGAVNVSGTPSSTVNPNTFMSSEKDTAPLASGTIDKSKLPTTRVSPGANKFWLNLASDVFNSPHGMAMFFKDSAEHDIGASYIENSYIQGHQISVSAGNILLMEGVSIQYDRLLPITMVSA